MKEQHSRVVGSRGGRDRGRQVWYTSSTTPHSTFYLYSVFLMSALRAGPLAGCLSSELETLSVAFSELIEIHIG